MQRRDAIKLMLGASVALGVGASKANASHNDIAFCLVVKQNVR